MHIIIQIQVNQLKHKKDKLTKREQVYEYVKTRLQQIMKYLMSWNTIIKCLCKMQRITAFD